MGAFEVKIQKHFASKSVKKRRVKAYNSLQILEGCWGIWGKRSSSLGMHWLVTVVNSFNIFGLDLAEGLGKPFVRKLQNMKGVPL